MKDRALLIPERGPIREVELDGSLEQLQSLVGGCIEAVPLPPFIPKADEATAYIHEDGKYECGPNLRATDYFVPGVGLFWDDYIAGPLLLCGFDPRTGEHAELPKSVVDRARLIEREAA